MTTHRSRRGNTQLQIFFVLHFVGVSAWMGSTWGVREAPTALARFVGSVQQQGVTALIPDDLEKIGIEAYNMLGGYVSTEPDTRPRQIDPTVVQGPL
jgi:hypothetical protein